MKKNYPLLCMIFTMVFVGISAIKNSNAQTYNVTSGAGVNSWYNPNVSNLGTILFSQGADDATATIPLPFSVPYFGTNYSVLYVSTNGWVSFFNPSNSGVSNYGIPSPSNPKGVIAPYHDDLEAYDANDVMSYTVVGSAPNRRVIVQYWSWSKYNQNDGWIYAQVHIYESGIIDFNYDQNWSQPPGVSASVGIQNFAGDVGYCAFGACGPSYASRPTNVRFTPVNDFTWTGAGDPGNWNDANNWDVVDVPTSANDVIIPASPPGPFPDLAIPGSYACNDLTIQSGGTPPMLQIRNGVELDVSGDFSDADGLVNVEGKLDIVGSATFSKGATILGSGEIEVDGSTTISSQTLTIGSGTFDANGSFTASGATIDMSSGGNLTLASTVTSLGTLDNAAGTVTYDGGTAIYTDTYNNLVFSSGNTHTNTSGLTINGNLTVSSGQLVCPTATVTGSIDVDGILDVQNSGSFTANGSVDIDGTLEIGSGTFDVNGSFDATNGTIDFTNSSGKLRLGSTVTSLGSLDVTTGGTVYYDGSSAQTIYGDTYNNLWIYNSTKDLGGAVTVNGSFVIGSGTVNVGSSTMSVSGLSNIDGTLTLGSGTFNQIGASDIDGYLNIGTGTYNADGTFDATNGDIDFTAAGKLILSSTVTSLGTLDNATGTVEYDAASTTVIPGTQTSTYTGYTRGFYFQANSSFTISGLYIPTDASSGTYQSVQIVDFGTSPPANYGSTGVPFTTLFSSLQNTSNSTITCSVSIQSGRYYGIVGGRSTTSTGSIVNSYVSSPTVTLGGASTILYRCGYQGYLNQGVAASGSLWGETSSSSIGRIHIITGSDQTLFADSYNNLEIDGTPSSVGGTIDVNGNLTVNSNKTLDMGSNALNVAGNITNNGTLTLTSNTTTLDGSSTQYINSNTNFNNLTINSAGVELVAPVDVNGVMTLTNGDVKTTSSYKLSIKSGGSVSGGGDNSHVVGPMDYVIAGTSETVMPIGDGNKYRPVYITPVSGGSTFTAEFKTTNSYGGTTCTNSGSAGLLDHVAGDIHWDISNNGGSNATIGLGWDFTIGVDVPADMRLSHWDGNAWEAVGQTLTDENGVGNAWAGGGRVYGAVTSFSPFNLGSSGSGNPLPIDLLSFTADCSHDIVDINFRVISQVNNDYFLIEKSKDAVEWEEVGTIEGAGTTNSQMDYSMVDGAADHGLSYYRLTQVDYDGTSKTFAPVSSSCESLGSGLPIEVYPNPMINEVTFELDLDEYQGNEVYYTILDARGSIVQRDNMELSRGFNKHTIDVQNLPNGVYILRFNNTRDHISETRIVKR